MSTAPELLQRIARPMTRAEYHRAGEAGLYEGERIELLHGMVVRMRPKGRRHTYVTVHLHRLMERAVGDRTQVRSQEPLVAADDSEPEPDIAIVAQGDYLDAHPRAALLVVEVADSSLERDLGLKAALYARMGCPVYWVVDVVHQEVVVHTGPRADGSWNAVTRHGRGATLDVFGLDAQVAVEAFLPPVV